eukprot:Selendium_serpulae@DN4504_c0_g1_i1.p1
MATHEFDYIDALQQQRGGFDCSLSMRNARLEAMGLPMPVKRKTGTTICGVVCEDCVVLAADTRATEGPIVADKNSDKLHYISDSIYCAGAGTSADLTHTTEMIRSNIELHRLATNTKPRVATVVAQLSQLLYRYQGHIETALVLGGVDFRGPHLYNIHPHGSTDKTPFGALGSGSLNAMAILEHGYKEKMTAAQGKALVVEAIKAGIFNDLGSGGDVDVVTVRATGAVHERGVEILNPRLHPPKPPTFRQSTDFYRERIAEMKKIVEVTEDTAMVDS